MRSFAQIIEAAEKSDQDLANELSVDGAEVKAHQVRDWRLRGSIPAEHWARLTDLGFATLDELAQAAEARKFPEAAAARQDAA